jgi:HEAT repeat protein
VSTEDAIRQLGATQSAKRRAAAKQLRRLRASEAGAALLTALEKEVQDPRTWETQYQLIMAIGECGHLAALPTLERLAAAAFEATMVYVALGDAIVRLSRAHPDDGTPILKILRHSHNSMLVDGAFRAMAMLRMVPDHEAIGDILGFVKPLGRADRLRFWVAAAAPGWKHPDLGSFLAACDASGRDDIAEAAQLARLGKYKKWSPL